MKKIVLVGNCQMFPVEKKLKSIPNFSNNFFIFRSIPVHVITKKSIPELYNNISNCDYLICNHINTGYRNNIGLDTKTLIQHTHKHTKIIILPSIHWTGQTPELFYFKNFDGISNITETFDYHNKIILYLYINGFTEKKTSEILISNYNSHIKLNKNFLHEADLELLKREQQICNQYANFQEKKIEIILFSEFIKNNYKFSRLFWTFNHPTSLLLNYITKNIYKLLENKDVLLHNNEEILNNSFFPISSLVYRYLGCSFFNSISFRLRNKYYSSLELVKLYFDFYKNNNKLTEYNIKILEKQNNFFEIYKTNNL